MKNLLEKFLGFKLTRRNIAQDIAQFILLYSFYACVTAAVYYIFGVNLLIGMVFPWLILVVLAFEPLAEFAYGTKLRNYTDI